MGIPLKHFSIFDFDLTISKKHTFGLHCIDNYLESTSESIYQQGKIDAENNIKEGVADFLKWDENHLSTIATYHNNPAYIAGYVSLLLGKELFLAETLLSDDPITAINIYRVEGSARPFLISYLPDVGNNFQKNSMF